MATAADLTDLITDEVAAALTQPDHSMRMTELRNAAAIAFAVAYEEAGGEPEHYEQAEATFLNTLNAAASMTYPDGTDVQVDRVASVLATAAANGALVAAAPGKEFEWITKLDDLVRETHQPLHGEVRAAGSPFIVGGFPLMYPGQPVGPPDVWINCRCTLHSVGAASAARAEDVATSASVVVPPAAATLAAAHVHTYNGPPGTSHTFSISPLPQHEHELTAASDKPWSQFSAADYTIEQWRRACLLKMPGGDPESKSTYKLPVREPGGALNVNGVHAAASRINQTDAPPEAKAAAKRKLRGVYRQIGEEPPDSLKADGSSGWDATDHPDEPLVAAEGTHDGPGWVTNPRETQKLRDYWSKGPGAAKIRWGTPNDLTRCEQYLSKYVGPEYAWGTCQNLHKETLGEWNPESRGGRRADGSHDEHFDLITAAFAAAAALEDNMDAPTMPAPPTEWFQDPGFEGPVPLTITSDGRVMGHLATWDTCHVGITGECVKPPRSNTGYAHFRTGEVETADGTLVAVGQITMDTGHAERGAGPADTVSHYDNTGTGVADVAAGEDEHGIWVAGAMRPGVSEQQMYVLKATGALSGDWRRIGGNLELVAALAVNVPGFPIPRVEMAASAGGQALSLVAAAVVTQDPNALTDERIVVAVGRALDNREADKARRERASALQRSINELRAAALTAAVR